MGERQVICSVLQSAKGQEEGERKGIEVEITDEKMEYLEILTKLELIPEEKERLKEDLGQMISWVGKLAEVVTPKMDASRMIPSKADGSGAGSFKAEDMDGRKAMTGSCDTDPKNVFREDEVCNGNTREALLLCAPEIRDGMIVVPAVL